MAPAPALPALPALPPATWKRRVAPAGQGLGLGLAIEGPLAVQRRTGLSAVPVARRGPWLAAGRVGPGARPVRHTGLVEGGQPVVLPAPWIVIGRRVVGEAPAAAGAWTAGEARGAWPPGSGRPRANGAFRMG